MSVLFVVDIDGTLADFGRRLVEAGPEPSRADKKVYADWVFKIQNEDTLLADKPVQGMKELIEELGRWNEVVYLTGREEQWRKVTDTWLYENDFPGYGLIMRPDDNYQETAQFKEDVIDDLIINYRPNSVVIIDDDQSGELEKMCKRRGWTFLKAMSGSGK
jgi:hypothetical protein